MVAGAGFEPAITSDLLPGATLIQDYLSALCLSLSYPHRLYAVIQIGEFVRIRASDFYITFCCLRQRK